MMPKFRITAPDGKTFDVEGPDGATAQDALAQVKARYGQQAQPPQQQPAISQEQLQRDMPLPQSYKTRADIIAKQREGRITPEAARNTTRYLDDNQGTRIRDLAAGLAIGAPSAAAGMLGDFEGLGRLGLSTAGLPVSTETLLPTSRGVGDVIQNAVGLKSSPELEFGRFVSGFAGPKILQKGAELGAKTVGALGRYGAGLTTGAGPRAFQEAYKAGKAGGPIDDAFLAQMRGAAPPSNVVDTAKVALSKMRADRAAAYKAGIGSTIKGDPAILDFVPIQESLLKTSEIGRYGDKTTIPGAQKVFEKVRDTVQSWATSDPAKYHTPEGLDALKQAIGNMKYDGELSQIAGYGKPGEVILNSAYNAVKDQIKAQAPGYSKVMKDYQEASSLLHEIERTLSINPKATVDTSLRKLQSIMRNNANTNYGARVALGEKLGATGDGELMPQIAGQSLNSWAPRGIMGPLTGAGGIGALVTNPSALAALPLTSPRVMGEAAHAAGKVSGTLRPLANALAPSATTQNLARTGSQAAELARLLAQQN